MDGWCVCVFVCACVHACLRDCFHNSVCVSAYIHTYILVLFNLYASVVAEKRTEAVQGIEEAGMELHYKLDQQLFRRSTRGPSKVRALKGEFADYVVLVATSKEVVEAAGRANVDATEALELIFNLSKTKFKLVGYGVTEEDKLLSKVLLEEDGGHPSRRGPCSGED